MNTLVSATLNPFVGILRRSGLLASDLDYHVIRASMVIIFLFFGYQKWFEYEAERLIPFISNGPLISWMYPVFGQRGASWFLGVSEWTRHSRRSRFGRDVLHDGHDHSLHAGRLGRLGRRISGDDGQRSILDEGCCSACRVALSAEAGFGSHLQAVM